MLKLKNAIANAKIISLSGLVFVNKLTARVMVMGNQMARKAGIDIPYDQIEPNNTAPMMERLINCK